MVVELISRSFQDPMVSGNAQSAMYTVAKQSISAAGRFLVYQSRARDLVASDPNGSGMDVFLYDRLTKTTTLVSYGDPATGGDGWSGSAAISGDGQQIVFKSSSTNLVTNDLNGKTHDVFLYDVATGAVSLLGADAGKPQISETGLAAWLSSATPEGVDDPNGSGLDVFVQDTFSGHTRLVTQGISAAGADGDSNRPVVSADGSAIAFASFANNLVASDPNGSVSDIFYHDANTGHTTLVSVGDPVSGANGASTISYVAANGRFVVFESEASNLVASDPNGNIADIFHHDVATGITKLVSGGDPILGANGTSHVPSVSGDGRFVVFTSMATNLVPDDTDDGFLDVFVYDSLSRHIAIVTKSDSGDNFAHAVSADGRSIAFSATAAGDYGVSDGNGTLTDLFVTDNPLFTIAKDDSFNINEDAIAVPIAVLANDILGEGVFLSQVMPANNGSVELVDGEILYSPSPDFEGADNFSYMLSSGDQANVSLTVMRSHEQTPAILENWRSELRDTVEETAVLQSQIDGMVSEISPSGLNLTVSRFAKLPGEPAMDQMAVRDGKLYVVAQRTSGDYVDNDGKVFEISRDPATGATNVAEFFDIGAMMRDLPTALGLDVIMRGGRGDGPRGLAFHPEFDLPGSPGYGKLYISMVATADPSMDPTTFLSTPPGGVGAERHNVTFEVTYDHAAGTIASESYREVIRDQPTVRQHPVRQISFNTEAEPGDEDYGLLYIIHGDGLPNDQAIDLGAGQQNNGSGKILRVDPLQNGNAPYTVPATNPFVGDPTMLDEVFALGLRNEHTISFHRDDAGETHLLTTGIGFSNIDEVNIIPKGANLGWSLREGHFITDQMDGNTTSLTPLPANEWELGLTYPVSFVAHDAPPGNVGDVRQALSGGHVISNGSELDGQYIFADFSSVSYAYHVSADEMFSAVNTLAPGEDPSALSWASPQQAVILFNHDNDPATTPLALGSFHELVGYDVRSDVRFGRGVEGELYILNKWDGWIYLVENSTPEGFVLPGGFEAEPRPVRPFDAVSDHYLIDRELPALNIFAFGGAVGLIENDSGPNDEPVIVAVNGAEMPLTNADGQAERVVEGTGGGVFRIAANGRMQFTPGDDFEDLLPGDIRTTSATYTLRDQSGQSDVAEVIVTVAGDAGLPMQVQGLAGNGGMPRTLVPGATPAFANSDAPSNADWTITRVPVALAGSQQIPLVQNMAALAQAGQERSFSLSETGFVYLALHAGQASLPTWLGLEQWRKTGEVMEISRDGATVRFDLFGRRAEPGEVVSIPGPDSTTTGAEFQSMVFASKLALFTQSDTTLSYADNDYVLAAFAQTPSEAAATASDLGGALATSDTADETAFLAEAFGGADVLADGVTIVEFSATTIRFKDSVYVEGSANQTWDEAQAEAALLGGQLLEIESPAERDFILQEFWSDRPIWLGLSDTENEGFWVGADGTPSFTDWMPGRPDDTDGTQNYARIATQTGQWDDATANEGSFFADGSSVETVGPKTIIEFRDALIGEEAAENLKGTGSSDVVFSSGGNDLVTGLTGADLLNGGEGDDTVKGGRASDSLFGGNGDDVLTGGQGGDVLYGGDGNDALRGEGFTDQISGGNGDDTLLGGGSADTLLGDAGDDALYGNNAADILYGGIGADILIGGKGNDELHGGSDADTLIGATGSDDLYGGAGADLYQFRAGNGTDRIHDFEDGHDLIGLKLTGIADIADLTLTNVFSGVDIGYGSGTIRVLGLSDASFSNADFVFG